MTKAFTAAAVSLLVDDSDSCSHVQWDTPISMLMPEDFVLAASEYIENVAVEDMLSHRSRAR